MKTILAICLSLAITATASAGSHRRVVVAQNAVVQGFVAVPFAVPVAVPSYVNYVAPQAFYHCPPVGVQQQSAQPSANVPGATEPGTVTAQEAAPGAAAEQPAETLVMQHCAKCHDGSNEKRVDLTGELSPEVRLKAIQKLLADDEKQRMPKGKPLDAQTLGLVIQELSKNP